MSGGRNRGIALLLVLWGVTLIAVLVAGLARTAGFEIRRSANMMSAASARAALDSGFAAGVAGLLAADPDQRWRADGTPYRVDLDGARFRITLHAENGRIDLNNARLDVLKRFLADRLGDELAARVVAQGRTLLGVDRAGFRPMLSVVEMAGVPGIDARTYAALAEDATVYNRSGLLDWRTADAATLALLPGMTRDAMARLLASRQESNYTPDPDLFRILAAAGPSSLSVENQAYTMRLSVQMSNRAEATAEVVFRITNNGASPYRILEWRSPALADQP